MTSNPPKKNDPTKLTLKENLSIAGGATLMGLGILGLAYAGSRAGVESVLKTGVFRTVVSLPEGYEIVQKTLEAVE